MTGCATSMFANRLSYFFDFKGPSYTVDTACSSSLLALDCALNSLRSGACDAAIVGGVNLCFRPQTSLQFLRLQMLSADGACRAFDTSGTGYVRSETVATVFIQKRHDAKRLYATLLHSKTQHGRLEKGRNYISEWTNATTIVGNHLQRTSSRSESSWICRSTRHRNESWFVL